jgi:hypothetical protein
MVFFYLRLFVSTRALVFTEVVQLVPFTNLPLKFLIRYLDGTFWSVTEFNSLWILLEVRGRYF